MHRRRLLLAFIAVALVAAMTVLVAGLTLRGDSALRSVEERYDLHAVVRLPDVQVDLPPELDAGGWDLKQKIIGRDGYDLRPYAGSAVTLQRYLLLLEHDGAFPLYLWLVVKDGSVVGAYATLTEASLSAPGVYSVGEVGGKN